MKQTKMQRLIESVLPHHPDWMKKWRALSAPSNQVNIAVFGSYNVGKSALLCSLTEQLTPPYFPINDVPETREIRHWQQGDVCYIDTPGLDVNDNDTYLAALAAEKADMLVLVHKLNAGSLQKADLAQWQRLYHAHNDPDSVLVVLTGAEEQCQPLCEEITHQLQQALNQNIRSFLVSNLMYQQGVKLNEPILIRDSGIGVLRQHIERRAHRMKKKLVQHRKNKQQQMISELLGEVEQAQAALLPLIKQQQARKKQFVAQVKTIQRSIQQMHTQG